uniref:Uncharacterized protein n=1 Tax=Rhizophagus irregularis (strain DAOM 181602 / DAOM 197198 / MUCL 43194) TaxID=747089 RepID=U9TWZ1_RHIID
MDPKQNWSEVHGDSSAHYDFHFTIPDDQKSFYLNFELQFSFEENKWRGPFDIR